MARVLVTGGAGFVGRRFSNAFLSLGYDVVCVDPIAPLTGGRHPRDWKHATPLNNTAFRFEQIDCRTFFAKDSGPFDLVVHLAAMVGGRALIEAQPLVVADDLSIDSAYWQWALRTRPRKTIYFSSSAAYPVSLQTEQNYRLLSEDDIAFRETLGLPDMTYGWAKLTGEFLCRLAYRHHGLHSVVYRPFSGYGDDQDMAYPFPAIAHRVLQHRSLSQPLHVWGSGRQMRDFIHIDDVVRFVLASFELIDDGSALNLSSGRFTSFIELAGMMLSAIGKSGVSVLGTAHTPEGVFARAGDRRLQTKYGLSEPISLESGIKGILPGMEASAARQVAHGG